MTFFQVVGERGPHVVVDSGNKNASSQRRFRTVRDGDVGGRCGGKVGEFGRRGRRVAAGAVSVSARLVLCSC